MRKITYGRAVEKVEEESFMRGPLLVLAAVLVGVAAVAPAAGTPVQTPKRGGTVVVAMNDFDETPCLGWDLVCAGRAQWRDKVLATPFRVGPSGYQNDLVSGFSLTKAPFAVTLRIRPQARWSDGVTLSAQDFVFAYRTYLAHSGLLEDDPFRTEIRRVRAVDAKTVRFVFRSRYGDWKFLLNFAPLPRHALRGADLAASKDLWRNGIVDPRTGRAIASGPFLVGAWEHDRQIVLVRNPRYWGRHSAYVDRIVLRFVPSRTRDMVLEALRSGAFDLGVVTGDSRDRPSLPGFRLLPTSWASVAVFEIRVGPGGHRALRDPRVRRALAYGVDRVALARELFGDDRHLLDNTIFNRGERNYRPNWDRYRYRPAEARRSLEQAGCRRGTDVIYSCAGERLRLRFVTTAGVPARERILQLVSSQLRAAGIEVVPEYVPSAVLFDTVLPRGEFDVALFGYGKLAPEDTFSSYRCGVEWNTSGFCSRLVTADIAQLDRIVDPARRAAVANRVDRRLAAAVPVLPLHQIPLVYVVREGLRGVVPNGFSVTTSAWSVWNAEDWWLER